MSEDEEDVALAKASEGASVAKRSVAKDERSPVQIRSGPPDYRLGPFFDRLC